MNEPGGKRSYQELAAICARLEAEAGHNLVIQRDLIHAKDRVDEELMRFQSIQAYIANALETPDEQTFFDLTLESIIEAFEHEVALFLLANSENESLTIAGDFGCDGVERTLPFSTEWIDPAESTILEPGSPFMKAWNGLRLASGIICPFVDRSGHFAGAILGGITEASRDYYQEVTEAQSSAFTVMVRQAGGLWINRQLNAEILQHNARLKDLTESYSRFVPFQFLQLLERTSIEEIDAGDHVSLDVSVLFADIRDFTTLSEQLGPEETFSSLNEFLVAIEPQIGREKGFINQYLGDAVMALFPDTPDGAVRCAIEMLSRARQFNADRAARGAPAIRFGLGVNSGPLMLGAIGGGGRLDSNVVGDTANLASRTEGLTKIYGVTAMITEFTVAGLTDPDAFQLRELDRVLVKGRQTPVTVYELLDCEKPNIKEQKLETLAAFAAGLAEYRAGNFEIACSSFENCIAMAPDDRVAAMFVTRCRERASQIDDSEPWQGISIIKEK